MTSEAESTVNTPDKSINLVWENIDSKDSQPKMFPIFYTGKTTQANKKTTKISVRKFRAVARDQMLLDAGQKRWGATQCPECKFMYHMGDPGDEVVHLNFHSAGHVFRFNGWKNQRVVYDNSPGKIIQIVPNDPKIWWKKVREVMEVINRNMGFFDIDFSCSESQIFFCIKNRIIVGALVAEVKTSAHRLLTTVQDEVDLCSEESYPIKCGVSRIWVAQNERKKRIATSLMECLKQNFVLGSILKNCDIAFSSPTELGKIFGQKYFKTPNFLVYLL